jgi:hypothetical protein
MALPLKVFAVVVALDEAQRGVRPLAALEMIPDDSNRVAVDIDRDLAAPDTFN